MEEFGAGLPFSVLKEAWFQHEGAPAHSSSRPVRFLHRNFPEQWIGRSGPVAWPPQSPDLSPLDIFLWGFVKNEDYATEPTSVDNLKQRIITA